MFSTLLPLRNYAEPSDRFRELPVLECVNNACHIVYSRHEYSRGEKIRKLKTLYSPLCMYHGHVGSGSALVKVIVFPRTKLLLYICI